MKILLIGNYLPDRQESMQRYADLLLEQLRARGHAVTLLSPPVVLGRLARPGSSLHKWLAYVDKFALFKLRLKRMARAADIVHICDHSNAMYVRTIRHLPHLVTCHDILAIRSALGHFPENPISPSGSVFQRLIVRGLRSAASIVCVSDKTRDDLEQYLDLPDERLHVVPTSLHWPYAPASAERVAEVLAQIGLPMAKPYFLHVGVGHWYKNRFAVLRIFAALRQHAEFAEALLVMTGDEWPPAYRRFLQEHGVYEDTCLAKNPSNEQLQALYTGAQALIFPSLQEGFGWPILEAQACGCPVAVLDRPPMNATGGAAAILIDADDPAAAANTIAHALAARSELQQAGLRNLERFTPDRMMASYLHLYRTEIAKRGRTEIAKRGRTEIAKRGTGEDG
jgi:glycosyltransferase involved in cell wall biosynthesis